MKDPVETTIQGYSNSAEAYKATRNDPGSATEDREYFINHMGGKKVLDVGCAHGRDVKAFYDGGLIVTGIDLTPEFVTMSKELCPEADIQLMDMRNLTFEDKSFDGIRCCASLFHVPKDEETQVLKEFHRILKKGGLLFLGLKEGEGEGFDSRDRFFAYWKKNEITMALEDAHFQIQSVTIKGKDNDNHPWMQIFAIAQ